MKLLHLSDTHLGFSEYHKVDPVSGLNQREQDFYNAWQQVMDAIEQHQPDVVVHAGDLFHTPRPSNRAIHVAMSSFQRLSDAGIPVVLIAGNHETPRIRTTGSIFESLALFPNVYAAFSSRYERFDIQDVAFHCVPHCSLTEELDAALQDLAQADKRSRNVLVSHGAWGGTEYGTGEFNEQRLPDIEAASGTDFDYIALGHYHRYVEVKENACYSSSTERTSLNEHNSTCGYLLVDVESGERTYMELQTRPMIKLPVVDCQPLSATAILQRVEAAVTPELDGAIVQLVLQNISDDAFLKLDIRAIDDLFKSSFYVEKQLFRHVRNQTQLASQARFESLPVEFERYLQDVEHIELDKKRLATLAASYLEMD